MEGGGGSGGAMAVLEGYHATLLEGLQALLYDASFADIWLILCDDKIRVARTLLAVISPVFRTMLSTDMQECTTGEVTLPPVTRSTWDCISDFYFSSRKRVTADNVAEVVEVSEMYQLVHLKNYCEKVLPTFCTPENCLLLSRVAVKYSMPVASRKIGYFLTENFMAISQQEDILALSESEMWSLTADPHLVTTEDQLCRTILAWMPHNGYLPQSKCQLLRKIRLKELTDPFLKAELLPNVLVSCWLDSFALEDETRRRACQSYFRKPFSLPRRRGVTGFYESLAIVGHDQALMHMEFFHKVFWRWYPLRLPGNALHDGFAGVQQLNLLVMTGGQDRSRLTFLYEPLRSIWSPGPNLLCGRQDHGMVVIEKTVYVVGGFALEALSSIEEYTPPHHLCYTRAGWDSEHSRQWHSVGNLLVPTDECGVTAVGDKIVVVGGREDASSDLIQTYDVKTNTAAIVRKELSAHMHHVRATSLGDVACFLSSRGHLVLIRWAGEGVEVLKQVQLSVFGERQRFGLCYDGNCVGVFGGIQDGVDTDSVEFFKLDGCRQQRPTGLLPLRSARRVYGLFKLHDY